MRRAIQGLHFYSFGLLRRLYDWVLTWAHRKYSNIALFLLAFTESSFFPIPPDVLQMALSLSRPKRAFLYAGIATIGSVLGAILGYFIGYFLYDTIGQAIIHTLGYEHQFEVVGEWYASFAFLAILISAFTPIPYKVFTLAAGFWHISLPVLVAASLIGRAGRFFLLAGLIYFFGPRMKEFIDKYFNLLTVIFLVLLISGFVALKYLL